MSDPMAPPAEVVDLEGLLTAAGDGVHWTLGDLADLNANLVRLDPGHAIGEHINHEVDVLIVVLAGSGRLTVEGHGRDLARHVVAHVPKATRRAVAAGEEGLAYLSVHRRRGPLGLRERRREQVPIEPEDQGGDPACWAHLVEDAEPGEP